MRAVSLLAAAAVLTVGLASSCGDSRTATAPVVPATGGSGGTTGDDGWALDTYCERAAPLFCDAVRGCCEEDFGFDADRCEARWIEELCEPTVALARSGRLRFTPAEAATREEGDAIVERCFEAFGDYAALCGAADWYDYWRWTNQAYAECRIFLGQAANGEACQARLDCAGTDRDQWVGCFDGFCDPGFLYQPGADCPSSSIICDDGHYCDAPLDGSGPGTCVEPTPLGEPCLKSDDNPECGWQAHCDLLEGVCKPNTAVTGGVCIENRPRACRSLACPPYGTRCAHPISWDRYDENRRRVHLDDRLCGVPIGVEEGP